MAASPRAAGSSPVTASHPSPRPTSPATRTCCALAGLGDPAAVTQTVLEDRKSTRLNSSHVAISYAVFCLKKKKIQHTTVTSSKIGACQDLDTVWINSQIKTDLTNKINVPTREQAADIDEYESKHEQGYGW